MRKSAPRIDSETSAMMKDQRKLRRRSKSTSTVRRPYMLIGEEFVANKARFEFYERFLKIVQVGLRRQSLNRLNIFSAFVCRGGEVGCLSKMVPVLETLPSLTACTFGSGASFPGWLR